MPYCIHCGTELGEDFDFCPECGERITPEIIENSFELMDRAKKKCKRCGSLMPGDMVYCLKCGFDFDAVSPRSEQFFVFEDSTDSRFQKPGTWKNKWVALTLCVFFGWTGAHKYYETKIGSGILYSLTLGLLGFGWIIDAIILIFKPNPYLAKKPKKRTG